MSDLGLRQWLLIGLAVFALVLASIFAVRVLVAVTSRARGGAQNWTLEGQPSEGPAVITPGGSAPVEGAPGYQPPEGGTAPQQPTPGAPGAGSQATAGTRPDLVLSGLTITSGGAGAGTVTGSAPTSPTTGASTPPSAVIPGDVSVPYGDTVSVSVTVSNRGGRSAMGQTLQVTLYSSAEPGGRKITKPLPEMGPNAGLSETVEFPGLASLAGARMSVWVALLPGDGGQTDQLRLGFVLGKP